MKREIIRQLKNLKHESVKPNAAWVEQNRAVLLSQIKNTLPTVKGIRPRERFMAAAAIFMPESLLMGVVRPLALLLIVAVVAPSLYYGTVMASQEALPGDGLYDAKRYTEKIQETVVGLIGDSKSETQLHVEFAKRRAEETSKIVTDPARVTQVASTVADLKNEITTVSDKLDQTNNLPADVAKDIQKNTNQIQGVLQNAKINLLASASNTSTQALVQDVKSAKDMVQDVSVKAVAAMVTKHLDGDNSVSKDDVKAAIDTAVQNTMSDVTQSKQNVTVTQNVLQTAKTELTTLSNSVADAAVSTTAKQINDQVAVVFQKTLEAAQVTDTFTQEAARQANEVKQLVGDGNLAIAVDRVKSLTSINRDMETISDNTLAQAQPLLPIVQVVKSAISSGTTPTSTILNIVSSTVASISSTSSTVSTTLILPASTSSPVDTTTPKVSSSSGGN